MRRNNDSFVTAGAKNSHFTDPFKVDGGGTNADVDGLDDRANTGRVE